MLKQTPSLNIIHLYNVISVNVQLKSVSSLKANGFHSSTAIQAPDIYELISQIVQNRSQLELHPWLGQADLLLKMLQIVRIIKKTRWLREVHM